jgi:hypothetical protein
LQGSNPVFCVWKYYGEPLFLLYVKLTIITQPLEIRDFDSYINVLEANEALAHFINEQYVSDEGYEAIKKDNASDKRDRAE